MASAPQVSFLDCLQQSKLQRKGSSLTLDDLKRTLAHLQELFCYNVEMYQRVIRLDVMSFPCIDAKTAAKTVIML